VSYNYDANSKTDRDKTPPDIVLRAVRAIHNLSIWQVTLEFNMNYWTLSRYCIIRGFQKRIIYMKTLLFQQFMWATLKLNGFLLILKNNNVDYILYASDIYFDFSPKEIRILTYDLAHCNSIQMPPSWITNKIAGQDLLHL